MIDRDQPTPETLTSGDDLDELEKVLAWMERIDDAYEGGSYGPSVAELIVAMKNDCDSEVIAAVQEARRLDARSRLTGLAQ